MIAIHKEKQKDKQIVRRKNGRKKEKEGKKQKGRERKRKSKKEEKREKERGEERKREREKEETEVGRGGRIWKSSKIGKENIKRTMKNGKKDGPGNNIIIWNTGKWEIDFPVQRDKENILAEGSLCILFRLSIFLQNSAELSLLFILSVLNLKNSFSRGT